MCPFWPAHRSSLQSCPRALQNPALIKRRTSFTRRHYSTVKWLVIVSFSVRAPEAELPNRQKKKTKATNKNPKEKERGAENTGGDGSKQPTACNAVLFKPNIFRNPQPRTPLPKAAEHPEGDYLKQVRFEKKHICTPVPPLGFKRP